MVGLKSRMAITRFTALAAAAVSILAIATPANAVVPYWVKNQASGKCLAVPNSSTANGTGLIQWTCNGNADQTWEADLVPGGDGNRYTFKNRNSGKCLAIPGSSTTNGTQAVQWTCNGGSEQLWIVDSIGRLRNVNSDRCLADPNSSTANGTEIIQWTCTENSNQRWLLY
ncbi:RICIN domain-containing protein [Streptomyces sp. NPDC056462]|uniref:RICIN domain-containing protein n=1 Tax=Streptomyces sp. NPDC056462 TaxID=3345826 RepID=UPI0036BEE524